MLSYHYMKYRYHSPGFTLIELLIVIAIIGILSTLILSGVAQGRNKAKDNSIRQDIGQLRLSAEQAFDSQNGVYTNWSQENGVAGDVIALAEDIDKQHGDPAGAPHVVVIRESQKQNYCISAPLVAQSNKHYCVDATGIFVTVTSACPDSPVNGTALLCPAS